MEIPEYVNVSSLKIERPLRILLHKFVLLQQISITITKLWFFTSNNGQSKRRSLIQVPLYGLYKYTNTTEVKFENDEIINKAKLKFISPKINAKDKVGINVNLKTVLFNLNTNWQFISVLLIDIVIFYCHKIVHFH